ncbi:MAG: tRNA uridine-5-carboxymethylaminomethyl(34) synthesis enzyme MnmG [Myxococcales bacterium]|nr:tRNA uridine-5-carboxymethylaminomethyl(34) synthesis enzyme MnmG [Myxococcales bacterium]
MKPKSYQAIVVGGGHAGSEAAHALAALGVRTVMLTMTIDTIGQMSCNPAIGGLAKSQLVAEIDALGGIMAKIADLAAIQYRQLNTSKGAAVRATRCQCDMRIYRREMQRELFNTPNLDIKQGVVDKFIIQNGQVGGVITQLGEVFEAPVVVLTTGTFLRGKCHVGLQNFSGGRAGDRAAIGLAEVLESFGLEMGRLKTGTTPRLDGRTIDWSKTEEQPSIVPDRRLSYYHDVPLQPQRSCWMTYTNERTHEIVAAATDRSPLFTGVIDGVGPRYCPSLEDKVVRFPDKDRHLVFLEPHGLDTPEVYPNGLSTSLPLDVQYDFVRSVPGLENAEITRPGYAVEYDFVQPTQLYPTMELKALPGLYLAGQINGTSGYEEAAAQGLVAGINAARKLHGEGDVVLGRDQAYIGVLIDDLVTKGTAEPYRMFTSRAEFRLILREDNADRRLSALGHQIGLLGQAEYDRFCEKESAIADLESEVRRTVVQANDSNQQVTESMGLGGLSRATSLFNMLSRPGSSLTDFARDLDIELDLEGIPKDVIEQVELEARYSGYVTRQQEQVDRFRKLEDERIPDSIDYSVVPGLSHEVVEKLGRIRPRTLGQASRIAGVTPAAVTSLMLHIGRRQQQRA